MLWDLTVFITRILKHNKIHLRELIKTNTENYIKLCKRKQITTKPVCETVCESCTWGKFVSALCLQFCFCILPAYAITAYIPKELCD